MKEKEKRYEESDNKRKCRYWLTIEWCRSCLFETLCHLEKEKWKATHDPEKTL